MMARRKKIWKGIALVLSVAVLTGGVVKAPVLEASDQESDVGSVSESVAGNTGAASSSDLTVRKSAGTVRSKDTGNAVANTAGNGEDPDAAPNTGNGSGDGGSQIKDTGENTDQKEITDSSENGTTGGTDSNSDADEQDKNGNTEGSGDVTPPAGGTKTDDSDDTDNIDKDSTGGTSSKPSFSSRENPPETLGAGSDDESDTGNVDGTDPGDSGSGSGTEGGGTGTGGEGTGGTGTGGEGTGGTGTGGEGTGGTGTGGEGTGGTDPVEQYKIKIDGNEVSGSDFATIWAASINNQSVTVQLMENTEVPVSSGSMDPICTLSGGNVTLDLNGHTLSYGSSAGRSGSGRPDLISVTGGTLTVKDSVGTGAIRYNGSSSYSGSCLYVGSSGALNIEGGTFSSTASAPVYIDGATLNVKGDGSGDITISAITMNNGKLNISGERAKTGTLTLTRSNNSMQVDLGKGSSFSSIVSKGSGDASAFKISELLADGCGFRSGSAWVTDEARLAGNSISNVTVDTKPFTSLTLQVSPSLESGSHLEFSYNGDKSYTLTASVSGAGSGDLNYQWYRTWNGTRQEIDSTGRTCTFSNKDDAGAYVYHVGVSSGDYEEWATFEVNIDPLSAGTVTNSSYQTTYTYGDFVAPPANGGSCFSVDSATSGTGDFQWSYRWYRNSAAEENAVNMPSDAGAYILRVEAADGPNYQAVGDIPVTITQRPVTPRIEGTTTKVYDGTVEAKGAEVVLDNVVPGDAGGVGVKATSIAYNNENVRSANRIVASGIELTGNRAGNYRLSSTQASVEASISKAQLLIQLEISPVTQKINRPVTVTVTALNSDNSPMDNNGLKAEDIRLFVSGRNDTEEEHTLALTASGSRYGVYTAEYTTGIKGDKTFTAEITGNANYEVSNVASDNTLTILEKTGAVMTLTANKTEEIVYGDEVTYTAVITKENEDDTDTLTGNVQFYEEEITDDHKIGSAQSIIMSGDKASVTLSESTLTAGSHKILAVFSGSKSFEDVSAEVSTSVAKKPLKWDVSNLTASKAAGTAGEVTVYGDLKLDGLLDEDDVKVVRPNVLTTNGLKSTEAGSYKVTVVSEDKEWKFDPEEPKNYELPEGDPEITAKVNAVKELPNPPADTEDGKKFKLVMEEGISTVPEGLRSTSFNTPAKIEQELKRVLTESGVYKPENTAVYDVVLQVSTDEGKTWQVADYTNFPAGGLQVTLPYPGGTGRYTNNFAVAHMFSSSYFGKTSGQVEVPAVRKTDNGMEFTVTGLSPIGLAWSGPTDAVNNAASGTGSGSRRAGGAATWDDNPILLYVSLAGGAALAIVMVVTVCMVRSGKKKKKSRR